MIPSTVRTNLKTALTSISGLRCYDIIPDSINVPAAVVGQLDFTFDYSLNRGTDQATCEVILIVSKMVERMGQAKLDAYLAGSGADSVKAAIEADTTLSGAVKTLRVTSAAAGIISSNGTDFLSYRYAVELIG